MGTTRYASDKFVVMLETFVASQASLQDRLAFAFTGELFELQDSCFPAPLLGKWQQIMLELRSAIDTSDPRPVMRLSDVDARGLITDLFMLGLALERWIAVDDYLLHGRQWA